VYFHIYLKIFCVVINC